MVLNEIEVACFVPIYKTLNLKLRRQFFMWQISGKELSGCDGLEIHLHITI